ncbi:MAG TPA: nicotinate-nucleotide--dimethylbenzimidazole phosphoribosyltransferase [Ilumatobacter sp.]|nr:nicotinate-nucleotide--dimethylbenzimidazole phosphoribosyltransferase [Ilumatobacter sp.]
MNALATSLTNMTTADQSAADAVHHRAANVLRPAGALQSLDHIAIHIAAWQRTTTPSVRRPAVVVFAGDHGIAAAGVSAYPSSITREMLRAVQGGRATVNAMAVRVGADVSVVDVGVEQPTGDFRHESALTPERFDEIVTIAFATVDDVVAAGHDALVLGELGIGNTTAAAAVAAKLLGGPTRQWVGRGTGVDDEGLDRKVDAVAEAIARIADVTDPLEVLREVGGSELVAIAAACARARHHHLPVVLDGYVVTSAVLALHCADAAALDHCLAGHVSAEGGHRLLLEHLGMQPILDLGMRLGEGSGALAALPIIDLACAAVTDVATFDEWFGS